MTEITRQQQSNVTGTEENMAEPSKENMAQNDATYNESAEEMSELSGNELFVPLPCTVESLRVQQTFNMWKAPLDIGWKFRRMKKRKTISLQPLDTFPDFVHKFKFKGQEVGFFSFLKEFTKIYFCGFNVDILETVDMAKAKWNITSRWDIQEIQQYIQ